MKRRHRKPRARALDWLKAHRGLYEQPANSNSDFRRDGIRAAELRLGSWLVGAAWCGIWFANALLHAGVDFGTTPPYMLAGVANIEDLARAGTKPFRGWVNGTDREGWKRVLRGDGVVLFGRGVHVETVRRVIRILGLVWTDGGNTSTGEAGSQSNGGISARRLRRATDIYGFALVNYPGGPR